MKFITLAILLTIVSCAQISRPNAKVPQPWEGAEFTHSRLR